MQKWSQEIKTTIELPEDPMLTKEVGQAFPGVKIIRRSRPQYDPSSTLSQFRSSSMDCKGKRRLGDSSSLHVDGYTNDKDVVGMTP
ncbi:uncharacterized protein CIMG_13035 [Coccidioides immitis RS]|uniref:Uncharacterized protein n=1 Tax=Coccidioides immitis (strain RS) TaxID=246410 RepID=A0A0D8JTB2_COCIM|nr:uncharacterized protein CIMG_13035 [Coccidioides immitis RS]KJF60537.1 hypothetical protein CIMG_13035 [Coccidioides immitis RS]